MAVKMPAPKGCCESTTHKVPTSQQALMDGGRHHGHCLMREGGDAGPGLACPVPAVAGRVARSQHLGYFIRWPKTCLGGKGLGFHEERKH